MLNKSQQKKLRKKLKHGDINTISEKCGMSREYVSKVLDPTSPSYNTAIIDIAIELAKKNESKTEQQAETIKSL